MILTIPELDLLRAEIAALRAEIRGATITPVPQWVTVREAAERLGCTTRTIQRKADAGEIEARGSGKSRMVRLP